MQIVLERAFANRAAHLCDNNLAQRERRVKSLKKHCDELTAQQVQASQEGKAAVASWSSGEERPIHRNVVDQRSLIEIAEFPLK
jgi:hypothetical protein